MPRTILIADDVQINRSILSKMLSPEYTVLEAENGKEALRLMQKEPESISAVLLDIIMPVMDGFEVLEQMRVDPILSQVPVIVTTGSAELETERRALTLGANDVVQKPFDASILKRRLENLVNLRESAAIINTYQKDRLTGLWSRENFFERVEREIRRKPAGHLVIVCVDINNFKVVNDQYGTGKGDEVLIALANALLESCIEDGGLCGRITADNFVVLRTRKFAENSPEMPEILAASIKEQTGVSVTISLGRYYIQDKKLSVSAMYDRAKIAQKTIKGRADIHIAVYDESMREQILRDQEIENEMRAALEARQFEVWFQPQYNHATGARIGAEALVRWCHPEKGLVPPDVFVPVFERNGFIYELDRYVWEEVCRCLREWTDEGRNPLPVSVNISRVDMLHPDLTAVLTALIVKYSLPVDLLRLEVTESAFSENAKYVVNAVKDLVNAGFTVEIDDFGSGYSSLNILKDVPAQMLKLDMLFIERSTDPKRSGNIIESVIRMAKWLGMSVIAEGIEDKKQADFLLSIGCNYIQGYLYAKPMKEAEYWEHCANDSKEEHLLALDKVENLDNNSFWDPQSLDTLIFNSYVGAACIFEVNDSSIEMVRANEMFAKAISPEATVESVLKLAWSDYIDESSREDARQAFETSAADKNSVGGVFVFVNLPGCPKRTYLRASLRVIAKTGSRLLVYCLVENITTQREAEKKAQAYSAQVHTMMDDAPGGFVRMRFYPDGSLSTVFINDTICEMRKMTREEILSLERTNSLNSVHPDDRDVIATRLERLLKSDDKVRATYGLLCGDGSYLPVNAYGSVTRDESGASFINVYYMTLSEQETQDYSIRAATPFILSTIMRSSPHLDFAKDKNFNYICCSPAFVKFTRQKSEADVIGKSDYDFWTKDEADRFRADDVKLFESGESLVEYTEPIPSDDGIQHYALTSKHVLRDSTGEIIGLYGSGRDITDTRSALEKLRLLTDSIPGGLARYAVTENEIKILYFNDGFLGLLGYTHDEYEEMSKTSVVSRVYPEDLPTLMAQVKELYKNGTPIDCTYRTRGKNPDNLNWVNIRGELAERNGDTCYVNAVLYDMTAQREATRRQEMIAQQLQLVMDTVYSGITVVSLKENGIDYLFANNRYYEIFGYTREQFASEVPNALDRIHPDDREWVVAAANRANISRETRVLEYRIIRRNGEERWVRVSIAPHTITETGEPLQIGVTLDVTSEKLKAQKLAAMGEELQVMMNDTPDGFLRLRLESDGRLRPVFANEPFCQMCSLSLAEIYTNKSGNVFVTVHPDDRDRVRTSLEELLAVGGTRRIEYRLRNKNGYIHVDARVRTSNGEDGETYVNAYYTDLSEPERKAFDQREAVTHILSAIMAYSSDYSFAKDRDFRYLCCSPAFLRIAEAKSVSDVVGKTDFDLFPMDMAEMFRKNDIELFESGQPLIDCEETIRDENGETIHCHATKYILHNSTGELVGIFGVSRDVTKIMEIESRLKLVTDSIPGGIAVYRGRADDPSKIKLSYFSDGFCGLFGYTRDEYEKLAAVNPMSLVAGSDIDEMNKKIVALVRDDVPIDYVYRATIKDGTLKWINVKAVKGGSSGDEITVNAVLTDVSELRDTLEQLRTSEEANRLAIEHSGRMIARFDIDMRTLLMPDNIPKRYTFGHVLRDVPNSQVDSGEISFETKDAYTAMFTEIMGGKPNGMGIYQRRSTEGWRWIEAKYTTLFSSEDKPISAVISFTDITEQRDKENIYLKWKNSLTQRSEESYTLFRFNLSKEDSFESREGILLPNEIGPSALTYAERNTYFAATYVYAEDRERFLAFADADALISKYYRGHRIDEIEFRFHIGPDKLRWLRMTAELVEYPDSKDIEAFLLYEDIDEAKRAELKTIELAETDPLTGIMNRATFVARVDKILNDSKQGTTHALLMLDLDGFKQVNDVFGHEAGDKILVDVAKSLCSVVRDTDLVGRLGGDEFVLFLSGIPDEDAAIAKAKQIGKITRKSLSLEVQVTGSVGIAIAPRDGDDFQTLYRKVDSALYYVKGSGKDSIALYNGNVEDIQPIRDADKATAWNADIAERKLRMLIVDDNNIDYTMLQNIFKDEFIIEKARDGGAALVRLRRYGNAISVVLLDLMMPGIDGFAVLNKMQESERLRSIPVIVVSGDESRDSCIEAIRRGATDYVTKPVDPDILRVRVHSAVIRSENERLKAQNALLEVQSEERIRYDYVLERVGITFIEYSLRSKEFVYYPSVSLYLAGTYDDRPFWDILLCDAVADEETVDRMQELILSVGSSRDKQGGTINVRLKTPSGEVHGFRMNAHKHVSDFKQTNKLMITLTDLDYKVE